MKKSQVLLLLISIMLAVGCIKDESGAACPGYADQMRLKSEKGQI